jgi:hypothetical protein
MIITCEKQTNQLEGYSHAERETGQEILSGGEGA